MEGGKEGVCLHSEGRGCFILRDTTQSPPLLPSLLPSLRQARRRVLHSNQNYYQQLAIPRGLSAGGRKHAYTQVGRERGSEGGKEGGATVYR